MYAISSIPTIEEKMVFRRMGKEKRLMQGFIINLENTFVHCGRKILMRTLLSPVLLREILTVAVEQTINVMQRSEFHNT